jgi:hypothetical protein
VETFAEEGALSEFGEKMVLAQGVQNKADVFDRMCGHALSEERASDKRRKETKKKGRRREKEEKKRAQRANFVTDAGAAQLRRPSGGGKQLKIVAVCYRA